MNRACIHYVCGAKLLVVVVLLVVAIAAAADVVRVNFE